MGVRSRYFVLTGGLGGLVGFAAMEVTRLLWRTGPAAGRWQAVLQMTAYFAGFGLAVGAALGMTEGLVRRRSATLVYGLVSAWSPGESVERWAEPWARRSSACYRSATSIEPPWTW